MTMQRVTVTNENMYDTLDRVHSAYQVNLHLPKDVARYGTETSIFLSIPFALAGEESFMLKVILPDKKELFGAYRVPNTIEGGTLYDCVMDLIHQNEVGWEG